MKRLDEWLCRHPPAAPLLVAAAIVAVMAASIGVGYLTGKYP